jgi:hypothetical protein
MRWVKPGSVQCAPNNQPNRIRTQCDAWGIIAQENVPALAPRATVAKVPGNRGSYLRK